MPQHEAYTTTVVGTQRVPCWYEGLGRLVTLGQLANAQFRVSQAAILENEIASIDVITGGEMHRRCHNRHSPPNAMLNHFRAKLPAFQDANRSKPISRQEPNVLRPAAVCRCPIEAETDLGLVVEFRMVSVFARGPVKITMAGPHLLAVVAYDEYYNDMPHMMADLGKMLNRNFLRLAIAGVGTSRSTRRISPWPMTPRSALQSPPSTRRSKVCRRMSM